MSDTNVFLKKVYIKNFLSLKDIEFSLKPLTVIVGPNASGKSNVLHAFRLLNQMMNYEELPAIEYLQERLWGNTARSVTFQLQSEVQSKPVVYELDLKISSDDLYFDEKLSVNDVQVISIQRGRGEVWDEDGTNETKYKSAQLALKSAGDYGDKPTTSILKEFVRDWEFYDFEPDQIRGPLVGFPFFMDGTILGKSKKLRKSPKLNSDGSSLSALLSYWHENMPDRFNSVSESLAACTNIKIGHRTIDGEHQLCLLEGYKEPILLKRASDGTLRLVAYYILLNEPELPPLIAIEEPERNLHPGALMDITSVLEQLAERTQVIITTHSSQLLDTFSSESLSDWLGVLLLRNRSRLGTEVLDVADIRSDRAALDGWIADFGIGSAVFNSGLLQDLMEDPECQA